MHAGDVLGVGEPDPQRDGHSPVAALHDVAVVPEALHQRLPRVRDPFGVPAGLPGRAGEAMAGHGGDDHVERVGGAATVRDRVGQRTDDVHELHDGGGPAVGEDHRRRVHFRRADVQEVHLRAIDVGEELRELVEPRLGGAPVVARAPVLGQFLEIAERHAAAPAGAGHLVGPAGGRQPLVQVIELGLRDVDLEGTHRAPLFSLCQERPPGPAQARTGPSPAAGCPGSSAPSARLPARQPGGRRR